METIIKKKGKKEKKKRAANCSNPPLILSFSSFFCLSCFLKYIVGVSCELGTEISIEMHDGDCIVFKGTRCVSRPWAAGHYHWSFYLHRTTKLWLYVCAGRISEDQYTDDEKKIEVPLSCSYIICLKYDHDFLFSIIIITNKTMI